MSDVEMVAASEVLGDMELYALPETCVPLDAIVLIKALDEDGDVSWFARYTENISQAEAVGALSIQHQLALQGALDTFVWVGDDEDDEDYF